MIEFLDELERDLVEAIDRRRRAPIHRPRMPRLRLDVAAAAAALAIAIALVLVIGSRSERETPVKHAATLTVPHPTPIPKGTPLRVVGGLKRVGPATWRGPARGPGGGGVLTLTGQVNLTQRPCCELPRRVPAHVLQFRWTTPRGVLGGCVVNSVLRRPYGRFVWDGPGLVKVATGAFARYRGRAMAIAGETKLALTSRARIILGGEARPPGGC
jgi:hypothetical protein